MFNFFKKSKSKGNEVKAPIKGNLIPLSEVSDDVFSQKMLGDGFAVKPTGQEVVAPVSGTITTLFPDQARYRHQDGRRAGSLDPLGDRHGGTEGGTLQALR
jgi:hypothetical protein